MKFSCDQCNAQYMIADEKVGARGVKVKCKKCTHIIIVKPPTTEGVTRPDSGGQQSSDSHAGGGDFFGDGPFNEPTQAMSREQLKGLMASSASDSGLSESDTGMPPGDMGWPGSGRDTGVSPPADDWQGVPGADSFGRDSSSMFDGGAAAGFDSGSDMAGLDNNSAQAGGGTVWPPADASGDPTGLAALSSAGGGADVSSGEGDLNLDAALGRELSSTAAVPSRPPGEKEWYIAVDESQIGPVDIAEIEQRWDALDLDEDSLAWKAGMQDWSSIAEIPELAYLITERPQKRPSQQAAAGVSSSAGLGVSGGGSLGPVAFGGESGGSADVAWTPSAASALSSLVEDELTTSPEEQGSMAQSAGPSADELGMPSFGASELFGQDTGGGNGKPATDGVMPVAPQLPPPAEPFPSGGASWSVPAKPPSGGGLRPVHLALAFMGLLAIGLVVVLAVVLTRSPITVPTPAGSSGAPPSASAPQPTPPAVAEASAAAPPKAPEPPPVKSGPSRPARASSAAVRPSKRKSAAPSAKQTKRSSGGADKIDDIFDDAPRRGPVKAALSRDDIYKGVKKGMSAVMGCIKAARAKRELAPGKHTLVLDWTIRANGSVTNPRLKGPAYVTNTSLPDCFARGMRKWSFPASKDGAPVRNFGFGPFTVK